MNTMSLCGIGLDGLMRFNLQLKKILFKSFTKMLLTRLLFNLEEKHYLEDIHSDNIGFYLLIPVLHIIQDSLGTERVLMIMMYIKLSILLL